MKKILLLCAYVLLCYCSYSQDIKNANVTKRIAGVDTLTITVTKNDTTEIKSTNTIKIKGSLKTDDIYCDTLHYNALNPPVNVGGLDTTIEKILIQRAGMKDTIITDLNYIKPSTIPKSSIITIYGGTHTLTTDSLAVDSCQYICIGEPKIYKTAGSNIFQDYATPIHFSVSGNGSFFDVNSGCIVYLDKTNTKDIPFEADTCISTGNVTFYVQNNNFRPKVKYSNSTFSYGAYQIGGTFIGEIKKLRSTSYTAFTCTNGYVDIKSDSICSTTSRYTAGIALGSSGAVEGKINANWGGIITADNVGNTTINQQRTDFVFNLDAYTFSTQNSHITINGNIIAITNTSSSINFNGTCISLGNSDTLIGGRVEQFDNAATGYIDCIYKNDKSYSLARNYSGYANIHLESNSKSYPLYSDGGITNVFGNISIDSLPSPLIVNEGGNINVYADMKFAKQSGVGDSCLISQRTGITNIYGKLYNARQVGNHKSGAIINKYGGTLSFNRATVLSLDTTVQLLCAPYSAQNIKVYSGGLTTNANTLSDLLSAKSRKDSIFISAASTPTSITINDGSGGAETFNCVTCGTIIQIATEMVGLINASGTLSVTATDLSNGSFYLESDVAGTNYTISGQTNNTAISIRLNSKAITETVGGGIINDPTITY